MKIAWIGTGVMGAPMARHIAEAGHDVRAYNRTYAKAKALEPDVKACETIADCVRDAEVVFTIVGYPKDVEDVYQEVFSHAGETTILIDMTTSSPTLAKKLALEARKHGMHMLDAPVTGGDVGARNAALSIMVGGDRETFDKVVPLLEQLGKTINYMGASGCGQHAKLANQAAIAGALSGAVEALVYAKHHGLDLENMLNVMVGGSAASWQAANNGPKMIQGDYEPGFFVKHFLKDLKLILSEKDALGLPIVEHVAFMYQTLQEQGYEDEGTQILFEYYQRSITKP